MPEYLHETCLNEKEKALVMTFPEYTGFVDGKMQLAALEQFAGEMGQAKEAAQKAAADGKKRFCPSAQREGFFLPFCFSEKGQKPDGGAREHGGKNGIGLIFKIAAVGILVTILSQILKHSGREEHAFLLSLAGLILVLTWIIPYIYDLFVSVQNLFEL